jgi:hypothetical protein
MKKPNRISTALKAHRSRWVKLLVLDVPLRITTTVVGVGAGQVAAAVAVADQVAPLNRPQQY